MKVVYNLIKYPLIFCFLGCFALELIIFIVFFITFNQVLVTNENEIKELLFSQTDELLNSIDYLIQSKLNSVENELLLFNQHMSVQYNYQLDNSQLNYSCNILPSQCPTGQNECPINEKEITLERFDSFEADKKRGDKIKELLQSDDLNTIVYYYKSENKLDEVGLNDQSEKFRNTICFALSFLKTALIKNIINNQHREKLNYTLYCDDVIFFYPPNKIDENILKTLPFFNPSILCRDEKYQFECSSILNFQPTEEDFTLYNSIIYMDLKSRNKNIYINMCLSLNDVDNGKINLDPYFLYDDEKNYPDKTNNFLCITTNLTNVLVGLHQETFFLLTNVIQYDEESDSIKVLYCSNENIYKDLSLNKDKESALFFSEEYGKYRIKDNTKENIADLFHIIYYEIEKSDHPSKDIEKYINEYESNIKEIKELIKTKSNKTLNGFKTIVNQSYINYNYNNKGRKQYDKSNIDNNEFIYYLKPIVTNISKINNKKNIIEKNEKYRKILFYTISVIKITKPKNTSFVYIVYLFICGRLFFYSLVLEFLVVIIFYIFFFFIMRCILNPFSTFKNSIESLLDMRNKNKKDEEIIIRKNKMNEIDQKMNSKRNNFNESGQIRNFNNMDNTNDMNKRDPKFDMTKKYMKNFMKITAEVEHQYTNLEMKEIENIIIFLQKILLLRDENTPYQAKAEFYQSISSEISKQYQLDLFKCQILIGEYYIKDKQYLKAKNELENLQIRLEQAKNELLSKDKFNEKKNGFLSSYYGTYINEFTTNSSIKEDKFIRLEMISESYHYLIGLANYFLYQELKHGKKKFMSQISKNKTLGRSNNNKDLKSSNLNLNNTYDINSGTNNITSQMDYYLEKAIKHFKESYKINNDLQINQIKNIIILVYLSKCYIEFSNKSIEEANKALKKAFLTLANFNELLEDPNDDENFSTKRRKQTNTFDFIPSKNVGSHSLYLKDCYVDSRVMLIVNGSLIQFILYQIGKMALKLHKSKVAYYCFVKLIQISYFKNENLHFKAIKWIRFLLNSFIEKRKNNNTQLKSLVVKFKPKRNNNMPSINLGSDEEILINKTSIDYMKKNLRILVFNFEKNKYKRREKKIIIELLTVLDKKIVYKQKVINHDAIKKKTNFKNYAKSYLSKINHNNSNSLTSSNIYSSLNQEIDESPSPSSPKALNEKSSSSPINNNETSNNNNKIQKYITKKEYEAITKSFISRDLFIGQIVNSPLKLTEDEKNMKYIDKQFYRLNPKYTLNKCLIIILSESFLQNFSSLKSFNLFIQDCIVKFLDDNDKIGYILYSISNPKDDKKYELEYKAKALKNLDELFTIASSICKNGKPKNKNRYLTDSFESAMEMFNNEQLNNNNDINSKTDKYIFCFGTLNNLKYKCYEASFAQKNRINYMEISLYYFVFDSIDYYKNKIQHYKIYFKKFIEGFLVFVENFKLIKLCFANICIKGKQKNLFSNKLDCIHNII